MIKLFDSLISDFLPLTPANEAHVKSIAYAINNQLKLIQAYASSMQVMCMIDNVPENILDMLAVEFKTQYYAADLDIERKRDLVRNTFIWYMTAGTKSSLEEAVKSVLDDAEVHEWFEYNGNPFTFKVSTKSQINLDKFDALYTIVEKMKNARSQFGNLQVMRENNINLVYGFTNSEYIANEYTSATFTIPDMVILTDESGKALLSEDGSLVFEEGNA